MTHADTVPASVLGNRLLQAMGDEERSLLLEAGDVARVSQKQVIAEPNQRQDAVYFPGDCVISLLTIFRDGGAVEVGTVGCEGMVGLASYLGSGAMPVLTIGQIPGVSLRVPAATFSRLVEERPRLRAILDRYTQALLSQVFQGAACNGLHPIIERCARWLLMTHDRVGSRQFPLTHELLAYMLGVRRAGVTETAGALQQAGYIRYSRGRIEILDRAGLESASCECYSTVKQMYEHLLGAESRRAAETVR